MLILVKLVGIFMIAMGTIMGMNMNVMKKMFVFWAKGKRLYLAASIRIAFGIIFLLAASQCKVKIAISILGVLMILGGALILILGLERTRKILDWWNKQPPAAFRLAAAIVLTLGILVILCA